MPTANENLRDQLADARQHLARRDEINRKILAWRDDLQRRLDVEQLRLEACGDDDGRQEALAAEVADFTRACRYFGWGA